MPPVVAGAAAAGVIGGIVQGSVVAGALIFGSQLVLGGLSRALQSDPDMGDAARNVRGRTETVRESIQPRSVVFGRVRKGGTYVLIHTTGNNNKYLHLVIALADHSVNKIGEVYFGDELAIDEDGNAQGPYQGLVQIEKRLGGDNQSAIDIPEASDVWGDDHRGRGVAHVYLRLEFDDSAFPNGIPNPSFALEGYDQVYDPRTDTTGYSENTALCLATYLANERWGLGVDWDDIFDDALIEAANVCDETVDKADGSTEPRYTCNGLFTQDEQPRDIVENLAGAMAGEAINVAGQWTIHAGAYREPDVTITDDDFRGGLKLQTRVSRRENFNTVQGTFISPENDWEPADFPEYSSDFYREQDGRRISHDIELPFTISSSMAQRIAKIELERARREQTLEAPVMLSGLLAQAGDIIAVDRPRWGFEQKPFEVREFAFADSEEAMGVDLVLRETSPLVYDWDATEEEIIEAAPPTTLPGSRDVPQPNVPSVSEELYVTRRSAGVRVLVELDWGGSETAFVDRFQVEQQDEDGPWRRLAPAETTQTQVRDLQPGIYRWRVRAINRLGVPSPWAETALTEIVGTSAPPTPLTGLTLSGIGGMAILRWDQHPDLDVLVGGSVQFRHARQKEGATWANSVSIGERLPGSSTEAVLPLKPGTYLAKPRDAKGQPALEETVVVTNAGTVLSYGNVDSLKEDPNWAGTSTTTAVTLTTEDGAVLTTDSGATLIGDEIDLEVIDGNLRLHQGSTSGVYSFAAGFDFGVVRKFRLRTDIAVSVINIGTSIDDRTANIDTWPDFDNTRDADMDIQIWVRTTDDDPNNNPTWSSWERIDSAEYEARGADFQARVSTEDAQYLPQIEELSINADEVV